MTMPSVNDLDRLMNSNIYPSISIYAPFIKPNSFKNPNITEINNMLKQVKITLKENNVDESFIKKTIKQVKEFINSKEQTASREGGLAIFINNDIFDAYHIPYDSIPYLISIQQSFNIEPLREIQNLNKNYYLLCIGHKNVRLYSGDRYEIKQISHKNFPSSLIETIGIDEYPKSRETHAIGPASLGKGSEGFHQQYNVAETDKEFLREFLQRIDTWVCNYLDGRRESLVLAGVGYVVSMYKKINKYPYLNAVSILGNQDHAEEKILREKAWEIIRESK